MSAILDAAARATVARAVARFGQEPTTPVGPSVEEADALALLVRRALDASAVAPMGEVRYYTETLAEMRLHWTPCSRGDEPTKGYVLYLAPGADPDAIHDAIGSHFDAAGSEIRWVESTIGSGTDSYSWEVPA